MAKFSIVIPVYRAEKTIRRCVESIENNTFKDVEIILVEDGSADNSWQVCQDLANEFSNVVAIHNEKNSGVSFTRNRGIATATGEYTMFVDSDDWVDEHYYEEFNFLIEKYNPEFAICGYVNHDEKQNGRTDIICFGEDCELQELDFKQSVKEIYDKNMLQQLWNKIFVTKIIQANNIKFDESISIGEDLRFILEYLKLAKPSKILVLNKALYHYMRDQDGSLMFTVGYESVEEPLINLRTMYELTDISQDEIDKLVDAQREKTVELYAYLIMHNAGMKPAEKKKLILALDDKKGKELYSKNKKVFMKEQVLKLVRR